MGCFGSKANMIPYNAGDDKDFHDRFLEDRELGEGEFGVVKLVIDMQAPKSPTGEEPEPYACKCLRKGITFKDNTIYTPLKPEILKGECDMLRTLNGERHVLKLIDIYETSSLLYIVTEFCAGGEMMEYVSTAFQDGLRSEDASRISFELLDAVDHCAKHGVLHRDIKPENVMFKSFARDAPLKLIDFGSGTMDNPEEQTEHEKTHFANTLTMHSTFAGSAFYISPEMFQRTYTSNTDVWSAGVTLYVLVAGYPADELQKAFNMLQKSKRDLRKLPNMPDNMPNSFFDLISELLVYRHKQRKPAGALLNSEFVRFHKDHQDNLGKTGEEEKEAYEQVDAGLISLDAMSAAAAGKRITHTRSVLLQGSTTRHTAYLEYEKFERSLTTLLATVLNKSDFEDFLKVLNKKISEKKEEALDNPVTAHEGQLQVIKCGDLKALLKEKGLDEAARIMTGLPNSSLYENFAYRVALLRPFSKDAGLTTNAPNTSNHSDSGFPRRGSFGRGSSARSSGPKKSQSNILTSPKSRPKIGISMTTRARGRDPLNTSSHL